MSRDRQVYHLSLSEQELRTLMDLREETGARSLNHALQALLRGLGSDRELLERTIAAVYKSS